MNKTKKLKFKKKIGNFSRKTKKKDSNKDILKQKKKNNISLEKRRILNKIENMKNLKNKIKNFKKSDEDESMFQNLENKNNKNKEIKIISNVLENQNFEITGLLDKVKKVNCETKLSNLMSNINMNIQEVKKSNKTHLNDKNKKLSKIKTNLQSIEDKNNYYTKKILNLQTSNFSDILSKNKKRENNLKNFENELDFFLGKKNEGKLENLKLQSSNQKLINFLKKYYFNLIKNN